MLRKLKALFSKAITLLSKPKSQPIALQERSKPKVKVGDMVGNARIKGEGELIGKDVYVTKEMAQAQLDKHTDFKIGESYRVGEAIVTLHPDKASMLKAIKKVEERRLAKEIALRDCGIEIMLMSPEELLQLEVDKWLLNRKEKESKVMAIMGKILGKDRYIAPEVPQIQGSVEERFKDLMKEVKEEEKVS